MSQLIVWHDGACPLCSREIALLRDRLVLEGSIRDAVGELDPSFGYADRFNEATGTYTGFALAKAPPEIFPAAAVLVRSDVAMEQSRPSPFRADTVAGTLKTLSQRESGFQFD